MVSPAKRECDLVLRDVRVIDGRGEPSWTGDVAVAEGRIAALGPGLEMTGREEVEGTGLAAAPGFIDVHTHDDRAVKATDMAAKLSQGVTTVVTGNCGISLGPVPGLPSPVPPLDLIAESAEDLYQSFGDYLADVEAAGPAVNTLGLVGHSTLRLAVMDRLDRSATRAECAEMRRLLDRSLEEGAIGLSTGLYYKPANAASTAEVIAISEPLQRHNALYTTHLRDESDHVLDAMEEAFEIGRRSDVPVILSHHKVTNHSNHGRTRETLPLIERRAAEQPVSLDVYPYAASSTVLDPQRTRKVPRVLITWSKAHPEMAGLELDAVAARMGCDRVTAAARLLPAGAVYFTMDEEDVRRVLRFPLTMVGSDGLPHDIRPHPRLWGTFPRVLGHYVREVALFGLEEAVRRMTSLPALRFGLGDRGVLRVGNRADIVVFDPAAVADSADFDEPTRVSLGLELVAVNGVVAYRNQAVTGARVGHVLRNGDLHGRTFS